MIIGFICICSLYTIIIVLLRIGFKKTATFTRCSSQPVTGFSVIIPFRNEAEHLPNLLGSICKLNYPNSLVEFIFVDDNSTDNSVEIIKETLVSFGENKEINYTILENDRKTNSPKKDAINTAIANAKYSWIITTDADCLLPQNWLNSFDAFIAENNPEMVVAPVNYQIKNIFLEQFQLLDFMSMQASTMGSFGLNFPFLCNGANLAYRKKTFLEVNGFEGNTNIASGDDVFLLEKFVNRDQQSVAYLKSQSATITTFPVKTWAALIQQRKRWAAKTANFSSIRVKSIGLLILISNCYLLLFLCSGNFALFLLAIGLKICVDYILFYPTLTFFKHKIRLFKEYMSASLLYPFFSLYVFILSVTTKYSWKGRFFRK